MVLTDLKEVIPEGYFGGMTEKFRIDDSIKGAKHFSYELRWGYLAGVIGKKFFFESETIMSPRQVAACDVLMNLGMLVAAEAAQGSTEALAEYAKVKGVTGGNAQEIATQLSEEQIPVLTQNVVGALEQYLSYLDPSEAKPFLPLLNESENTKTKAMPDEKENPAMVDKNTVFVIHGRDEKLRTDFFQFLRAVGLKPLEWSMAITLTENGSPFIGDVLETAFNNVQAIVVLLSPDDEVRLYPELCGDKEKSDEKEIRLQARPNVLFEAGMAFGKCKQRTVLVEVGDVKPFSDIAGRHAVRLTNASDKRKDVISRLQTAGCDVSTDGSDWLKIGDFTIERKVENISESNPVTPQIGAEATTEDIQGFILSWWQKRATPPYDMSVNFQEVDRKLGLPKGSTKNHIDVVAREMEYEVKKKGNLIGIYRYSKEPMNFDGWS